MSHVPPMPDRPGMLRPEESTRAWLILAAGLLALAGPTIYSLATTIWPKDEHAHGPLIIAISAWLAWGRRERLRDLARDAGGYVAWAVLGVSLLVFLMLSVSFFRSHEKSFAIPQVLGSVVFFFSTLRCSAFIRPPWPRSRPPHARSYC